MNQRPLVFKWWHFEPQIILCAVRWYLRFRLSYGDLASIVAELGVAVSRSAILCWVVRYTEEFARRWEIFELVAGESWRADETYI